MTWKLCDSVREPTEIHHHLNLQLHWLRGMQRSTPAAETDLTTKQLHNSDDTGPAISTAVNFNANALIR